MFLPPPKPNSTMTRSIVTLLLTVSESMSLHTEIILPSISPGAPELGVEEPMAISSGQPSSSAFEPGDGSPQSSGTTESSAQSSRSIPGNQLTTGSRSVSDVSTRLVGDLALADSKIATVSIRAKPPSSWETVATRLDAASLGASVTSTREIGGGGGGGGLAGSSRHRGNASVEGRRKHSGDHERDSASAVHAGNSCLAKELSGSIQRSPRHGGLALKVGNSPGNGNPGSRHHARRRPHRPSILLATQGVSKRTPPFAATGAGPPATHP